MATTKVDVMNRALAAVGQAKTAKIVLPDENTSDANTINRFYDETKDAFLEEAMWSWATKYALLSLDTSDAPEQWIYTYKCPADCVAPRRIVGAMPEEHPEFEEGMGGSDGKLKVIWADKTDAELEYTARVDNFNAWSPAAVRAFALLLAIDIAPAYSGTTRKTELLEAQYENALEKAIVSSHNRQERRVEVDNEFIEARHGDASKVRASARFDPTV